jgi:zinc resistance-associated protein
MWKTVLAGTTLVAITGATFAYADQGPRGDHAGGWHHGHHWRMSTADITAFADARIAALKAGLELTPEQEKNWPALESAMRDMAKQRADRVAARQKAEKPADPIARLSQRAEAMESRGAALKKLAEAAAPLYQSLNDAQKHRFMVLARLSGRHFGHGYGHHGWRDHDSWRHGPRAPKPGPGPQ